jgi:hypothetical protein
MTQAQRTSPVVIPVIVWLLIQLAAIALAASGVELSANFPRPAPSLAVHEMLVAQFVGAATFLSLLFRGGWRAWLAMVLIAGPMLMLAGWLARMEMPRVMLAWGEVGMWLTALALWNAVVSGLGTPYENKVPGWLRLGFRSILPALAMLLSAGGLVLWYLYAEFRPAQPFPLLRCFPLVAALRRLGGLGTTLPLHSTTLMTALALVILAAKASLRRVEGPVEVRETTHPPTRK